MADNKPRSLFDPEIVSRALVDSLWKFDPRVQVKNPVMFVVEVTAAAVTIILFRDFLRGNMALAGFDLQIAIWLWFTVLFANFAEAMAEGRGKAQADNLRKTRVETRARVIRDGTEQELPATSLRKGDVVMVRAGEVIPGDGEVIEGVAAVNEAAITGESAPVIRESGGDRSGVTGGTTVISDWIRIKISANPGETFLDRMIALVEGAQRQKTPNEIALSILLAGLTIIFMLVCVTLFPFAQYGEPCCRCRSWVRCWSAYSNHDRRSALRDRNCGDGSPGSAQRARDVGTRVEAAGDVDTLLLDKTGTITLGDRMASEFIAMPGTTVEQLADSRSLHRLRMRRPKAARSWCWQSANSHPRAGCRTKTRPLWHFRPRLE